MPGPGVGMTLPLQGIRVVEFTHMVMGPTCGMVLADLGAEVIKVEPLAGDSTRRLLGSGAGFFGMFNRNKQSLAVDVADARGREIVLKLLAGADVFSENFKTGTMDRLGLGADVLQRLNPRLITVAHKGFLPGPYQHRTALDEVARDSCPCRSSRAVPARSIGIVRSWPSAGPVRGRRRRRSCCRSPV